MQIGSATFRDAPINGDTIQPPDGFGGETGEIFIYGAPGKGGDPGKSGKPGQGGDQGQWHNTGIGGSVNHGGNPGTVVGPPPHPGQDGARTQ